MQRSLHIVVCDLVTSFGGVQRVMAGLLPELQREGFEISVVDAYCNKDYAEQLHRRGVKTYFKEALFAKPFIGGKGHIGRFFCLATAIPRLIRIRRMFCQAIESLRPDAIYCNQLSALRLIGSLGITRHIPLIYHAHGFARASDISRLAAGFINRRVKAVIAVSQSTAAVMRQVGIREDILSVCYNGVAIDEIEQKAQGQPVSPLPRKETGQTVFLLPATFQLNKGHHLAIEALSIILKRGCNAALWFAGDVVTGGDRGYLDYLHSLIRNLKVEGNVHFLGWRSDVYSVIRHCDVVMLCSFAESFGMVLAEAMVLAKPCIGAAVGGMAEVIENGKTGLVFEKGSSQSLAEAMEKMVNCGNVRAEFAVEGRRRAQEFFSIQSQQNRIRTIIRAALRP